MSEMNLPEKETLSAAMEMEKKGYDFFNKSAGEAGDKMAKEVFDFLATEELNHIKAIEKFNDEFLSGRPGDVDSAIKDIKAGRAKEAIETLFQGLADSKPVKGSELDVYKFAMDFERKGQEFYKKAADGATDPNAKKLFEFLVGEERKHFKIVEACLAYFDNPEDFFREREGWHLEG
ncbi:MAG: ferritin family protein [candidate division Zixibacteria bacterium]